MSDHVMRAAQSSAPPERRLVAVGSIRQHGGRTTRIVATVHGAAGSILPTGACPTCKGHGGRVHDTSSRRVVRRHWTRCRTCGGTGTIR